MIMSFSAQHIRPCRPEQFQSLSSFLWKIYQIEVAPHNREIGHANFQKFIHPKQFLNRHKQGSEAWEIINNGERVAMCENRHQHVFLLFVAKSHRKRGLGKQLLRHVQEEINRKEYLPYMTLNAAPNSLSFYEKLGFLAMGPEEDKNGIRSTPMKLSWKQ